MADRLRVCLLGGRQAGIIGALTLLSKGVNLIAAVSYSEDLEQILNLLKVPVYKSKDDDNFINKLKQSDLLISVHGREIIDEYMLKLPKKGSFNVHPYLYRYKGVNPVQRALEDGNYKASVGVHAMEKYVDEGEVIVEEFVDVSGSKNVEDVYNRLYPYYCIAIFKALDKVKYEA